MDVTVADIALAHREGYESVEHLKRYTTLGMGTDQGKTSNFAALAAMAALRNATIPDTGTTTFRPPFTPVAIGALAGRSRRATTSSPSAARRCMTGTWRTAPRCWKSGSGCGPGSIARPAAT